MTHLNVANEPTAACGAPGPGLTLQALSQRAGWEYERQAALLTCSRCRRIFQAINT